MKKVYSRPLARTISLNIESALMAVSIPVVQDPSKEIDTETDQLSNGYRGAWDSSNWE